MKLICALILWQVLLQVSKEDSVLAGSYQNDKSEDVGNNNNHNQILKKEIVRLKKELESKNEEIKDLQEIKTELQRELESKYDPVGKCSMPTVRAELNRQHRIVQKLAKNLNEKQIDVIDQFLSDNPKTQKLRKCEKKLKSQKNTIKAKDSIINRLKQKVKKGKTATNQLEEEVKELVSQLQEHIPKSCIKRLSSGPQYITLSKGYTFKVLCNSDIAGPGWTVIQQRIDGKVDFYRDWNTYRDGFGDFWDGEFFLGLEKIHRLTAEEPHELYIHMERFNGSTFHARYDDFAIAGEHDLYELIKLGAFSGNAEYNALRFHENMEFTTYDRDNDRFFINCAKHNHGGWWYRDCAYTNLNGRYYPTEVWKKDSIYWEDFIPLKHVKMMIRPKVTSK